MAIKKTMHELAKEFPNKTYRELEKYRDADRNEEAQRIITQQENEGLKEDQLDSKAIDWKARSGYLQSELDRVKRENNDLHDRVNALLDAVDPAKKIQKARESGF